MRFEPLLTFKERNCYRQSTKGDIVYCGRMIGNLNGTVNMLYLFISLVSLAIKLRFFSFKLGYLRFFFPPDFCRAVLRGVLEWKDIQDSIRSLGCG